MREPSRLTRRSFLHGTGALALWGLAPRAGAESLPRLNDGQLLPDPDFDHLRAQQPHLIGVRPHRHGGVRLELDPAPLAGTTKRVVHNYGHGGAGITLSWGCASLAVEHVEAALRGLPASAKRSVAVLGTGVIGLTTATELRRAHRELPLRVYARDLDVRSTTSWIAGGQFEPSGIFHEYVDGDRKQILADYLRRAKARIQGLLDSPDAARFGVAARRDFTLDHACPALEDFTPRDVVAPYRRGLLPFARLDGVGREYRNWLMNPTLLLPTLASDLRAAKVEFEARTFASVKDVAALPESVIVNCTGLGAGAIFGDTNLVPQRGHLVVLQRTDPRLDYFFSDGCADGVICYVFCRQNDVVVGGTVISHDDSTAETPSDEKVFAKLVANGRKLFGGHPASCRW